LILVFRRFRSNLAQLLGLAITALLAISILAGAPMYLKTIESLGLRSVLDTLSPANRNLLIYVDNFPLTQSSITAASERVEITLRALGGLPVSVSQESHTRAHYWAFEPDAIIPGPSSDSAILNRFVGFPDYVEFVDGRSPDATVTSESGFLVAEAAIPFVRAEVLGVNVGDDIWLASSPVDLPYLKLEVVGIFTPDDLQEEFWFDLGFEAVEPPSPSFVARQPLPLFIAGDGLFDLVTGGPASIGTSRWLVQLDIDEITNQGPAAVERQIEAAVGRLRLEFPDAKLVSALENRFKALREEIVFARIPVLMMGGVVLAVSVFLSITSAGSLVSRTRVDTGRLRARGFSRTRIALIRFYESAPFVLVPVFIAPFIAFGVISSFDLLPEYELATLGRGVPVRLSWQAFVVSFAGGIILLTYMQLIAFSANSREIDSERLTLERAEGRPFFQRHYLDLIFLIFGSVVLWDLTTEESVVAERTGQISDVGQLLVFAPAIFLGVVIVFSLRIMPEIARLASWIISKRGPAWLHIFIAMFARLPNTYAWPIAIIGMATGSIVLSATASASLERSASDQAGYEAGADLRALPVDFNNGPRTEVLDQVRNIQGVTGASIGLRAIGALRDGGSGAPFEFLAIEPEEFSKIAIFRDDYADGSIDEVLSAMNTSGGPGSGSTFTSTQLIDNPDQVGIRFKVSSAEEFVRVSLRLMDAVGRSWSVDLGPMTATNWEFRTADVPESAARPVEIAGVVFFEQANDELGNPMTVLIDELVAIKTRASEEVTEPSIVTVIDFGDIDDWHPLASSKGIDTVITSVEHARSDQSDSVIRIELGVGTNRGVRGIVRSATELVPVLFSAEALEENGLSVGNRTVIHVFEQSVPVRIVGEVDYFPTMNLTQSGYVISDSASLWTYLSMSSFNSAGFLEEMFIGLDDPDDQEVISNIADVIGGIHTLVVRNELQKGSLVTPLAIAGWRGAAIVSSVLVAVLGVLGFLVFAPDRPSVGHHKLAVLGALGIRKWVLLAIAIGESVTVLVIGFGIGLAAGIFMARLAVDTTTQTVSNGAIVPPVQFSTEWAFVGVLAGALVFAAVAVAARDYIVLKRINFTEAIKG
jgi:hypothetical protein